MLLLILSDTAATSQDGSSLEFIAAIAGRLCFIQDASSRGLRAQGIGSIYIQLLEYLDYQDIPDVFPPQCGN